MEGRRSHRDNFKKKMPKTYNFPNPLRVKLAKELDKEGKTKEANIWKKASEAAGMKISPQVMRKWHSSTLGELMVPDRYVDIFQGRAPRSVLAKYYTCTGLKRLKQVNDNAALNISR